MLCVAIGSVWVVAMVVPVMIMRMAVGMRVGVRVPMVAVVQPLARTRPARVLGLPIDR